MRPPRRRRALFWVIDKIVALFNGPVPPHWLSILDQASGTLQTNTVKLYQFDGRTYPMDELSPARGWADIARAADQGTLAVGGKDTSVMLSEVTDPILTRQVRALWERITPPERSDAYTTRAPVVFEITPA